MFYISLFFTCVILLPRDFFLFTHFFENYVNIFPWSIYMPKLFTYGVLSGFGKVVNRFKQVCLFRTIHCTCKKEKLSDDNAKK